MVDLKLGDYEALPPADEADVSPLAALRALRRVVVTAGRMVCT